MNAVKDGAFDVVVEPVDDILNRDEDWGKAIWGRERDVLLVRIEAAW